MMSDAIDDVMGEEVDESLDGVKMGLKQGGSG